MLCVRYLGEVTLVLGQEINVVQLQELFDYNANLKILSRFMEKHIMFGIIHLPNETLKCLTPQRTLLVVLSTVSVFGESYLGNRLTLLMVSPSEIFWKKLKAILQEQKNYIQRYFAIGKNGKISQCPRSRGGINKLGSTVKQNPK